MALPTQPWEPDDEAPAARVVRPYTLTGGRTASVDESVTTPSSPSTEEGPA